ncbi:hypothetical protein BJX65DRAFT_298413 [Aspergillus insuetus]
MSSTPLSLDNIIEYPIFDYVAITSRALCGICWVITYVLMIHKSFQQRTYSIPIITLLFNIGWEFIYTLVYGDTDVRSQGIVRLWPLFNLAVLVVTIKFAPNEWEHSPLVRRNIPLIFVLGLAWSLSGHWALASEMGPGLAFYWSGAGCQILTSVGLLCQLLCRGSTRGSSYLIWFMRLLGSSCGYVNRFIMASRGLDKFPFFKSPVMKWYMVTVIILDAAYGVCFHIINRQERSRPVTARGKWM